MALATPELEAQLALVAQAFRAKPVGESTELARILSLPRRSWTEGQLLALAIEWTKSLRTPNGKETLFPIQAQALAEAYVFRALFGPICVGGGKTLISFLIFTVLGALRPLLVTRASLQEKTRMDLNKALAHWKIHRGIRITSYEMLSRDPGHLLSDHMPPDVLVLDEAHMVKNLKAACSRRIERFKRAHPTTIVIPLSGTMTKRGVKDFAHLSDWALGAMSPAPRSKHIIYEWAGALDERVKPTNRRTLGALQKLMRPGIEDDLTRARLGFQDRLIATPGVVATSGESVGASIEITPRVVYCGSGSEQHFELLRTKWTNPDGDTTAEAIVKWGWARRLALGFHYYWTPAPPKEWLFTRAEWHEFAREKLKYSRTYDTELQIRQAVERGEWRDATETLAAWKHYDQEYRGCMPLQRTRWHDTTMLEATAERAREMGTCLIWTEFAAFGRALATKLKVPYAGRLGLIDDNTLVDYVAGKSSVVLSTAANANGRNLQDWNKNLIPGPEGTATLTEQLIGRTHRRGQTADTIEIEMLLSCSEHEEAIRQMYSGASTIRDLTGASQKVLIADWHPYETPGNPRPWSFRS